MISASINSNKCINYILNPGLENSAEKFQEFFARLKKDQEKDAIALIAIALNNNNVKEEAFSYLKNRYPQNNELDFDNLPQTLLSHFWLYIPTFVQFSRNLSQYLYLFEPFLPSVPDESILNSIFRLKSENQVFISQLAHKIQSNDVDTFIHLSLIKNNPSALQIQILIPILESKTNNLIPILIDALSSPNQLIEYALSISLSSTSSSRCISDSHFQGLAKLFFDGKLDFRSPTFSSLCFYINRYYTPLAMLDSPENADFYPYFVFSELFKIKPELKEFIIGEYYLDDSQINVGSIIPLLATNNKDIYIKIAIRLLQLEKSIELIGKIIDFAIKNGKKNIEILMKHLILVLFIRIPINNDCFSLVIKYLKKLDSVEFYQLQFLRKIADLYVDNHMRESTVEILTTGPKSLQSDVFNTICKFIVSDSTTIDEQILSDLKRVPKYTILSLFAISASLSFNSDNGRREKLTAFMNNTVSDQLSKEMQFDKELIPSEVECPQVGTFYDLFLFMTQLCGKHSDLAIIHDNNLLDNIRSLPFEF